MVFSTRPGGTVPGTQICTRTPEESATYSKARCGCPNGARFHAGAVSPIRWDHQVAALPSSTLGGTATCRSAVTGALEFRCEVGQQGSGAFPGARIARDPFTGIGGDHGAVEGGAGGRSERFAEHRRDKGLQEQRPPSENVIALTGGQIERVKAHPRSAESDVCSADRAGQTPVFVFGIYDRHLDLVVEQPEYFEFGEVGLA
jgi:hypothetical protein